MPKNHYEKFLMGDIIKYLPSTIIIAFSSILILPVLTKYFDTISYGNYSIALSSLSVVSSIASIWLSSTIIRFKNNNLSDIELKSTISTFWGITVATSVLIAILYLIMVYFLKEIINTQLSSLLLLVPLQIVGGSILILQLQFLRVKRDIFKYNIISIAKVILPLFSGLIASKYIFSGDVYGMSLAATVVVWGLVIASHISAFNDAEKPSKLHFDKRLCIKYLKYGTPLIPSVLMVQVLAMSDRFLIAKFAGVEQAGIYAANHIISTFPIDFIITLISGASAPLIVSNWEKYGRKSTERFLYNLTRLYLLISIPTFFLVWYLSNNLVEVFTNSNYLAGSDIIPIVSCGTIFLGLQWIAQRGMILANNTKSIFRSYFFCGIFNMLLNLIFIPIYGYMAAALINLLSYILLFILISYGSSHYLAITLPYISILRSITSSIISLAVLKACSSILIMSEINMIFCSGFLFFACYFCCIIIGGELKRLSLNNLFK